MEQGVYKLILLRCDCQIGLVEMSAITFSASVAEQLFKRGHCLFGIDGLHVRLARCALESELIMAPEFNPDAEQYTLEPGAFVHPSSFHNPTVRLLRAAVHAEVAPALLTVAEKFLDEDPTLGAVNGSWRVRQDFGQLESYKPRFPVPEKVSSEQFDGPEHGGDPFCATVVHVEGFLNLSDAEMKMRVDRDGKWKHIVLCPGDGVLLMQGFPWRIDAARSEETICRLGLKWSFRYAKWTRDTEQPSDREMELRVQSAMAGKLYDDDEFARDPGPVAKLSENFTPVCRTTLRVNGVEWKANPVPVVSSTMTSLEQYGLERFWSYAGRELDLYQFAERTVLRRANGKLLVVNY